MNDIHRAAIRYARKGLPVFPCDAKKRPMVARGFHAATTDERQIEAWFGGASPPLIGIPTGEASGVWILDVDRKEGVDGGEALDRLVAEHGPLPDVPISMTPTGGEHYVFRYTGQVRCSAGALGPGLDVRGDGGYFIAPPSSIDGRRYEFEASSGQGGPQPAPEWLQRLVRPPAPRERRPYQAPTDSDKKRALAALQAIRYGGESRDEWVEIGMAFAAAGGDFEHFDAWCQGQPGYVAENVVKEWESFSPDGGVTPGTLYWHAKRHGWRDGPELRFSKRAETDPEKVELEAHYSPKGEFRGYKPTLANLVAVLEHLEPWAGRILYDEMTEAIMLAGPGGARRADDVAIHEIRVWLDTGVKWTAKPTRNHVFDAVDVVARRAAYHPVRDYLSQLQWDGVERLPYWLEDVCGVARTPYTMAVAAKMLIGAVARVMEPGCKLDTMAVFVGPQGAMKSTMIRELFGWHVDTPIVLGSKDAYQTLRGAWGYEFAELASFHGREVERLKAFFSSSFDTYRPSYGRMTVSVPRQCIFVATTNDYHIFHDTTGARRFWPVEVSEVDVGALREVRDQLWAEAVQAYHQGEVWHMEGEAAELAMAAAEEHRAIDPWEETIAKFVFGRDKVSTAQVLEHLGIDVGKRSKSDSMRIGRVLRDGLKWRSQTIRIDGEVVRGFRKTKKSVTGLHLVTVKSEENQ